MAIMHQAADISLMEITLKHGWDACLPSSVPEGVHALDYLVSIMFANGGRNGGIFFCSHHHHHCYHYHHHEVDTNLYEPFQI